MLDGGLDLRRLDAVAVDLDHVIAAALQHQVPVSVFHDNVPAVEQPAAPCLGGLLREIAVAADIGVFIAELARRAVGDVVSAFIEDSHGPSAPVLADGRHIIGPVQLE